MDKAKWLARALQNSGLSQAELARRLSADGRKKYHPTMINKMLTGERCPSSYRASCALPHRYEGERAVEAVDTFAHLWLLGVAQRVSASTDAPTSEGGASAFALVSYAPADR